MTIVVSFDRRTDRELTEHSDCERDARDALRKEENSFVSFTSRKINVEDDEDGVILSPSVENDNEHMRTYVARDLADCVMHPSSTDVFNAKKRSCARYQTHQSNNHSR